MSTKEVAVSVDATDFMMSRQKKETTTEKILWDQILIFRSELLGTFGFFGRK